MKKKLLSVLLASAVTATGVFTGFGSPLTANAAVFSDISTHWAKSYIEKAADKGIISGYPDGTFLPDNPVKRSEFTKMVNNAFGNTATSNISFSDVPSYEWYYSDVAKAVASGYAGGYDTGDFKPDNYITRQEAAVMLSRIVPAANSSANLSTYADKSNIADWAESSLSRIVGKKYMGAYDDGRLHPLDNLTRAQAAKIITDIVNNEKITKTALTIKDADTELSNRIYTNGITIHKDVADGAVKLDNCVVLGAMYVQGGGSDKQFIDIVDSRISELQISKAASSVKVRAKGDTRILTTSVWKEADLVTSSLGGGLFGTGFDIVNIYGSSKVSLDGNFPVVNITGRSADVDFTSGTIKTLDVSSAAANSEITLDTYATITTADVNAAVAFKGGGTIKTLNANASGISYETKPSKINTAANITGPSYSDAALDISPNPSKGATDISVSDTITLSFASAVTKYNGKSVSDSDLTSMIELRKKSSSGTKIVFSASINSSKKKITITPDSDLDYNTKYYVIIKANTFKNSDGQGNEAFSTYFTTASENSGSITISPKNKATDIAVSSNITITFPEAMRMRDDSAIKSSNISKFIELRKGSSSGSKVSYSASINSSKKVITIDPSSNLDYGTKYYVIIDKNSIENSSGKGNAAFSSYFTTADYSYKISSITASSNEDSITVTVTPSQKGDLYAVLLTKSSKAPSASQIKTGQDGNGNSALRVIGKTSVNKDNAKTLPAFTGLDDSTEYVIYCVLVSGSNTSPVASKNITTTAPSIPNAALTGINIPSKKSMSPAFSASTTEYNVTMPFGSDKVSIAASADSGATIKYSSDNSSWSLEPITDASISGATKNKFYIEVLESSKTDTVYTVTVTVDGDTDLSSVSMTSPEGNVDSNAAYTTFIAPSDVSYVEITIRAKDSNASIVCTADLTDVSNQPGVLTGKLAITSDTTRVNYTIKSNLSEKDFSFTIEKKAAPNTGSDIQAPENNN